MANKKADQDGINKERAAWAGHALSVFQANTRTDDTDALKDLLCDLMHWCDERGEDFDIALDAARHHHKSETSDE